MPHGMPHRTCQISCQWQSPCHLGATYLSRQQHLDVVRKKGQKHKQRHGNQRPDHGAMVAKSIGQEPVTEESDNFSHEHAIL